MLRRTLMVSRAGPGRSPWATLRRVFRSARRARWPGGRVRDWRVGVAAFAVAAGVLVLYAPAGQHAFLDYDDRLYVTDNPHVRAGLRADTLRWALTSIEIGNWHPLALLSHALDVELFGLDAGAHHRTSVWIHAATAALLLSVLASATGSPGRATFAAALFAFHPLRVESVAWVAERKDVLCGFFWVLALAAHLGRARHPGRLRAALVTLATVAAIASKAMAVTLPVTLWLFDVWPLGRLRGGPVRPARGISARSAGALLREKALLLVLCGAAALLAVVAQRRGGALGSLAALPLSERLANALVAIAGYLRSSFWPADLSVFHPIPPGGQPTAVLVASALVVVAASAAAVWSRSRRPAFAVGWVWFLVTLLPVIGLVQVGQQAMADRYTYVPGIGLAFALVWGVVPRMPFALGPCAPLPPSQRHWSCWRSDWRRAPSSPTGTTTRRSSRTRCASGRRRGWRI